MAAPHAFFVELADAVQEREQRQDDADAADHHHAEKEVDQAEHRLRR